MNIGAFIIPSFLAGILTFLAPCTLPLVPAYLSFISGSSALEGKRARSKILLNAALYVLGFSAVFIFLGSLFGLGGAALLQYRFIISRLGGILVILFGIFLILPALASLSRGKVRVDKIPLFSFLARERSLGLASRLKPGKPTNSFLFGAILAAGWSPCVGPILATVLTLAASSATVGQGTLLLSVFSAGLAVPFLASALAIGWASEHFSAIGRYLSWVALAGGVFLILLGVMMVTDNFNLWVALFYRLFDFLNYEALLRYL